MRAARAFIVFGSATLLTVALAGCGPKDPPRPAPDAASRRTTASGNVVGFVGEYDSHVWLGVPFAAPPVGELRWRVAQPPPVWTGTREALAFGSSCPQYASPFGGVKKAREGTPVGSEDCLYLNIYAPRFTASDVPKAGAQLPVMLWIHGGGNTIGEAAFYNGGNLAAQQRVIVITTNYRLGPFGWFRHAAMREDGATDLDRSGNFGTLDLVRALQWIHENVAAFGGDPNNVTIFGESAGGTNVFSLLLAAPARGLFHRAIVESGGLQLDGITAAEEFADNGAGHFNSSNEALLRLLQADGAANRDAAKARVAKMSGVEIEKYLRGKSTNDILLAYPPIANVDMIDMPKVFRDGVVLPVEDPLDKLSQADGYNKVPVIFGTNRDENKLFMQGDPKLVRRILWIIPRIRDPQHYNLQAEYMAKMWKANGADEPASAMRGTQPSVYAYRFDWDEEPRMLGTDLSELLGAAHAFEIPFVFGHFDLGREGNMIFTKENEPGRKALSAQMMSYWAEFAYTGAPGRGRDHTLAEWTAWDSSGPASPKFMIFDTPADGGVRMSSDTLTAASVLAAVDNDPRLPTQRDKCMIYRDLAQWSRGFTKKDYPTAGRQGCKEYPLEAYPWG